MTTFSLVIFAIVSDLIDDMILLVFIAE